MVDIDNPRCRLCRTGECQPIPADVLSQAMGLETFRCNYCGAVFAWRHAAVLETDKPEEVKAKVRA